MALEAAASKESKKEKTPRGDQAEMLGRTLDSDVFVRVRYGGRRSVLAGREEGAGGVRAILEHLGVPTAGASLAPAQGPSQAAWC
ncbi:ATP-dependent helicase HrpA [Archangium sp.]|uniref:ATP-dependent helicase HrpA n=1 Tax=Archangium sp. TaxID=1872627 RepID=UPI002D24C06E|nr:ATP-dependent helicase HrpA [Archangium sp.]HYO57582.1 ATP-dependent helicase HrpA [Archangium sp.]